MAPRDFPLQDGDAFLWLYLLPDGMQAPAYFPLTDFSGGLYAVAADADGATDMKSLIDEVDAFLAQYRLQRDPSRPQMGHVITSPAAVALLGFEQMDYFFPIQKNSHDHGGISMKKFFFILLNCTWGVLTTLVGLIFFLKMRRKYPHKTYRGCIDTQWNTRTGLSLGLFLFTPREDIEDSQKIRVHEYGHTVQSIVLGPLFFIPGMISLIRGRFFGRLKQKHPDLRYTSNFVESWASRWGEMATGEEAIWD